MYRQESGWLTATFGKGTNTPEKGMPTQFDPNVEDRTLALPPEPDLHRLDRQP